MPASPNLTVEDAWRPAVRRSAVEVELALAPKLVVWVNGKAKVARPRELVAVRVYPPDALPRRRLP